MSKLLFYALTVLSLSLTACQKENEDYGVHTMIATVLVKQTGVIHTQVYGGNQARANATITKEGVLRISLTGKGYFQENLSFTIDRPINGLLGTYTLRSNGNTTADAAVNYSVYRDGGQGASFLNIFDSDRNILEGSLQITGYDNVSRKKTINGTYRVVIKEVRDPTQLLGRTTDADNSDVTIRGTFGGAWVYQH